MNPERKQLTLRERLLILEPDARKLGRKHVRLLDAFGMRIENFTDRSGKKFLRMVIGRNKNLEND